MGVGELPAEVAYAIGPCQGGDLQRAEDADRLTGFIHEAAA
ncbi:MAG: hypothetical protein ACTHK3_04955 [Solirubrobacterales bacterium]